MAQEGDSEADDYMSMTFADEAPPKVESSLQRRARQKREAERKSHPKSKAEIEDEEATAREAALATSLDSSNKGFKMLEKLGFKGGALGKEGSDARTEPIALEMKGDRAGVGLDSERKRKFREEVEDDSKKPKLDEGDYRERLRQEKEEKRLEGMIVGAMNVAEKLDEMAEQGDHETKGTPKTQNGNQNHTAFDEGEFKTPQHAGRGSKPLRSINVLWRNLQKHRLEKERDRRMRYDLQQSLTRRPTYDDPDEDKYDKQALGKEEEEDQLDQEDAELDGFNALEPQTRLSKLVAHLRETHHYCFWCKFQYPSSDMEGCPGVTEEDHD